MLNPYSLLEVPMPQPNDAGAATIRDYLIKLLSKVWEEDEGFDGKRPFGNSGWQYELTEALVQANILTQEDFNSSQEFWEKAHFYIASAIRSLGWVDSPEPPPFANNQEGIVL